MRELSLNFRAAINAQESGEVPIILITIDHVDLVDPIRLSTDPTTRTSGTPLVYGTTSRGDFYTFLPMSVTQPDEREGAPPRSQIRISNITREIVELVRSVTTPARAKIEIVLATALDAVEVESPWLDVLNASNAAGELTLDLGLNAMTAEQYPSGSFDPASFPGLHR